MPKLTGQFINDCAKNVTLDAKKVSSSTYLTNVVKKRYLGQNTKLGAFVNAFFVLKLMSKNFPSSKNQFEKDCNEIHDIIKNRFELELPLNDWFDKMVQTEEEIKLVDNEEQKQTVYSLDENRIPDVPNEDIYESYGTEDVKTLLAKHPELKPSSFDEININRGGFFRAARDRDTLHDIAVKNWEKDKEAQLAQLYEQYREASEQYEVDKKPENWDRINVLEESDNFHKIKDDSVEVKTMYARVRQNANNRPWYDYIFHPIRTYQEYSLKKQIEKTLVNDFKIKDLDVAFRDGVKFVETDIYNKMADNIIPEIDKMKAEIAKGYDESIKKSNKDKNLDSFREGLEKSTKNNELDNQITEKVNTKTEPTKEMDLNKLS